MIATDLSAIRTAIRTDPVDPVNWLVYADLSITDAPDDMTLYRDRDEDWKNYSASHDWLRDFAEFCLRSKGFQVF